MAPSHSHSCLKWASALAVACVLIASGCTTCGVSASQERTVSQWESEAACVCTAMRTGGRIPAASLVERLGRPDYKFNYTDLTHMWPGGFHQKVLDWMLYGSRLPVQSRQAVMESCEFYIYDEGARYPEPASPSMPPKWARTRISSATRRMSPARSVVGGASVAGLFAGMASSVCPSAAPMVRHMLRGAPDRLRSCSVDRSPDPAVGRRAFARRKTPPVPR